MLDIFCNTLEFFSFTFVCGSLLNKKIKPSKHMLLLLLYLLPNILLISFSIYTPINVDFVFCTLIWLFYIKKYFNISTITSLCTYATGYFIIIIYQFLFVVIDTYTFNINTTTIFPLIGAIYSLCISIILYNSSILFKIFIFLFENGKTGKFIIINLFSITTIATFYFHANLSTYYENILYIIVALTLIIICNMLLSNQLGKIKDQELKLNTYNEYLPVLEDLIHTVRVRQHNYNNKLQTIVGLLYTHKDYYSLSTALKEQFNLATSSDVPEYLLKVNLPVVAGFLYQKSNEAKKNCKTLELIFNTYVLTSPVPEYDLIEMFGILIDNAIDAISIGCTAYATVDCDGQHITFTTRNIGNILTPDDRKRFFSKGFSTKKDTHHSGLGLYQLNRLIKQYPASTISLWNEGTDILFQIIV